MYIFTSHPPNTKSVFALVLEKPYKLIANGNQKGGRKEGATNKGSEFKYNLASMQKGSWRKSTWIYREKEGPQEENGRADFKDVGNEWGV